MKSSQVIAIVIAVLALLWIISGVLMPSGDTEAVPAAKESPQQRQTAEVRVRDIKAEPFINDILITGRTHASRSVSLKAETSGQIKELLKEKGEKVAEDEVLAVLEVRDRNAQLQEARERVQQREIEYNAAKTLENKGFNSRIKLAQSRADLENARAMLKQVQVDIGKTKILAPFEGVINTQDIEIGDYVAVGDPAFTIVDLDPLEITGYVTERRIAAVQPGQKASIEFLEGETLDGMVSFVSPAADPQTRTFRVDISIENPDYALKEGLTATLRLPVAQQMAHKISPSILTLNDAGVVGVKIIETGNKVKFLPVTILADTPGFMWVQGLPDAAQLITVGQDFVVDGQSVKPVKADGDGLL